ncbi:LysR family transcriptional regulator [Parendozoicomonas haliclonae]|uniref:HTH-type transcriptional regulator SyrM 1 n=1 Tax=Parendozoicomonas haliclonae TaxID=1960125 RepID=A0A1X7AL86_9GAMM|nr:LysR family transcriptional regulator [Parendozoicomonas haliclonae]SMA47948.1 HTH-type transcriptional regulator SyrM 1 [Parendozoicomonas haliclonae]
MVNISRVDLNLLVYLDALLREQNVTRAADQLGISQPAMSNGLRRLRNLFADPLLVRTSDGMTPTARALELQPLIRQVLTDVEQAIRPQTPFDALSSKRVFRIMASDYAESTLIPLLLRQLRKDAPHITLDMLTPSDVGFADVEQGRVDMAINRFDDMPQSFHQSTIWEDSFSCILSKKNLIRRKFTLENYLQARHIWVSKTGMGAGVGVNPEDIQRLGWVDDALNNIGKQRQIAVFTRHYHVAMQLARQNDLIATLPTRAAKLMQDDPELVILPPPFLIPPIELKMAWSPLLQQDAGHRWLRRLIVDLGRRPELTPSSHRAELS